MQSFRVKVLKSKIIQKINEKLPIHAMRKLLQMDPNPHIPQPRLAMLWNEYDVTQIKNTTRLQQRKSTHRRQPNSYQGRR